MSTMGTMGTLAIDVRCPHCLANADQLCIDLSNRNGRMVGRYHHARVGAAAAISRRTNKSKREKRKL